MPIIRWCCLAIITALVAPSFTTSLAADDYPERPVELIVPWGVGGGADQFARAFAPLAEQRLGVPMPVINAPGSASDIGLAKLKSVPADGYAVAIYISGSLARQAFGASPHSPDDFAFIIRPKLVPTFLFVLGSSEFNTAQDLFEFAKANPGELRAAGTGVGTMDDLTLRFMASKGVKLALVSYAKPAQRYAAALGGHNEVLIEQAGDVAQYIDSGLLRPLVVFAPKRITRFPKVPTAKELGFDITHELWLALVARSGTPAGRLEFLAQKFEEVVKTDDFQEFARAQLFQKDSLMVGEELEAWVEADYAKISRLLDQFGLKK